MKNIEKQQKCSGFTLVELVIVIAIVIILSVVSVPIYRGYTRNAKMSEGYALLGLILSAQKAYYSQYGNFLNHDQGSTKGRDSGRSCYEEVLGIDARGNRYFTLFEIGWDKVDTEMKEGFYCYVIKPEELRGDLTKDAIRLNYSITKGTSFSDNVKFGQ